MIGDSLVQNLPLPEELAAGGEGQYLRRQRAVAVRSGRLPALRGTLWSSFAGVGLAVLLAYASVGVIRFVLAAPLFTLKPDQDVTAEGNHFVSSEELTLTLDMKSPAGKLGANTFRLNLESARRQVQSIPWVRSATLSRAYPHRLRLRIVEREPKAFAEVNGQVKLIDSEGVILDFPAKGVFDLPVVSGLDTVSTAAERKARLSLFLDFARVATGATHSGWLLSEANLSDPEDLTALLVEGRTTVLAHFGHKNLVERFRTFTELMPKVLEMYPKVYSIDLRFRNQVVVNPGGEAGVEGLAGKMAGAGMSAVKTRGRVERPRP